MPNAYTKRYYIGFKSLTDALVLEKKNALAEVNVRVFKAVQQLFAAFELVFTKKHAGMKKRAGTDPDHWRLMSE